jgi:hypothetical protein
VGKKKKYRTAIKQTGNSGKTEIGNSGETEMCKS